MCVYVCVRENLRGRDAHTQTAELFLRLRSSSWFYSLLPALRNIRINKLSLYFWYTPTYMSTITLCMSRYISLTNRAWAGISAFLMVANDCIQAYMNIDLAQLGLKSNLIYAKFSVSIWLVVSVKSKKYWGEHQFFSLLRQKRKKRGKSKRSTLCLTKAPARGRVEHPARKPPVTVLSHPTI